MRPDDPLNLAQRVAAGERPDTAWPWLAAGLRRYLRGEADLETALQLGAASRVRARNAALVRAARLLVDDPDTTSAWELAGHLERAVSNYEAVFLPRLRRDPATALPDWAQAIRQAFDSGARPLRSRRRLYDILLR